ncbi:MAG: 30S ribosomal protein S7 [Spirochaetales bacterium]|nr:30S ribosomal protein S7 [Leptospiraceae bacterium]MCP5480100.1 30S ribosomal protein S7 [Spirochaetales bacterium]MCP5485560.1 30S ribosomal protein S7 [Spirochaetales bacterium]
MSRRSGAVQKRPIEPDAKYGDPVVSNFINYLMRDGKKSVAERVFYGAMEAIEKKSGENGLEVFRSALANVKPQLEVRSRRVGGVTYQVPVEVRPERMQALAIRWMVTFARARKEHGMAQKLAGELMDAHKNQGGAVKKRDDTRRMADANKAFSHYRW